MLRPRNFVARSPLLRKGCVHEVKRSSVRNQTRRNLENELLDWEVDKLAEAQLPADKHLLEDEF